MANEVSNILDITFPEEMRNRVEEIMDRINEEDNLHCVYDNVEMTRDWYENNIGAKWARLNDAASVDYGSAYLNVGSAWHEISGFVKRFNELTDNQCTIRHEFVDEAPLFAGVRVYEKGEMIHEDVYENLEEMLEEETKKRSKGKTFESEEEKREWMWDWMWDYVYGLVES